MTSIKFVYDGKENLQQFNDVTITGLLDFVENTLGVKSPILSYKDQEGDMVRIADNQDLQDLLNTTEEKIVYVKAPSNTAPRINNNNPLGNNNAFGNLFQQMMPMAQQLLSGMQNNQGNGNNNAFGNLFQQMMPMAQQFLSGMQNNQNLNTNQSNNNTNTNNSEAMVDDDIDDISPPSSPEVSPPSSPDISPPTSPRDVTPVVVNAPPVTLVNTNTNVNVPKTNLTTPSINLNLRSNFGFPTIQEDYSCIFISHSSIEEGMKINNGWKFNKVWNVKNNGNKKWLEGTRLEFIKGINLSINDAKIPLLDPNEEGKISLAMQAPQENGRYVGYYQLKNLNGHFGVRLWVHIIVQN